MPASPHPLLIGSIPCRFVDRVWHVGTLRLEDKFSRLSSSLEGGGLSVSHQPEAWRQIAQLGDAPAHELSCADGRFVDYHELAKPAWETILDWGIGHSYVTRADGWSSTFYDDDDEGSEMWLLHGTYEAALFEADGDETRVSPRPLLQPTSRLEERCGPSSAAVAHDHLLTLWVEDMTELDGVWWDDNLDVARYSAPRGVISPARVERWSVARI